MLLFSDLLFRFRWTLVLISLFLAIPHGYASPDIEIVVTRSKHELLIMKQGNVLHSFKVALGNGGKKAKLRSGDHLTPTGIYRISKIRDSQKFHMFIQLNYPNMKDAVHALKSQTITRAVYRNIMEAHGRRKLPPQNTALGGAIGFHGIGLETQKKIDIHEMANWTKGCIAMRNDEIEILSRYVHVGTRVKIVD